MPSSGLCVKEVYAHGIQIDKKKHLQSKILRNKNTSNVLLAKKIKKFLSIKLLS